MILNPGSKPLPPPVAHKIEKIEPIRRGPRYQHPFTIEIATDKEEAKAAAEESKEALQVFTDGSEIDGKVGARQERRARDLSPSCMDRYVYSGKVAFFSFARHARNAGGCFASRVRM